LRPIIANQEIELACIATGIPKLIPAVYGNIALLPMPLDHGLIGRWTAVQNDVEKDTESSQRLNEAEEAKLRES